MATHIHCIGFSLIALFVFSHSSETPVIGILSQEAYLIRNAYPEAHSFIAASYVKLLESSGAQVIPIWIGQEETYYERVVNYTNGVLFPGGGTYFNETDGYSEAAKVIYKFAIKANDDGDPVHYPLLGVCLGMQVLVFAANDGVDIRKDCVAKDLSLPLEPTPDFDKSKLFRNATPELIESMRTENITYNYHRYCILENELKDHDLLKDWSILSTNKDNNELEFVSSMENRKNPFYAIQFHPEKTAFEFKKKSIPRGEHAVQLGQYLSNFFVAETRKNNHTFPTQKILDGSLIYNYNPKYSVFNTSYEQIYTFKAEDYPKNQLL